MDRIGDTRIADICTVAVSCAPPHWARLVIDVWANVSAYEISLSAQDSNGRSAGEVRQPNLTEALQSLREEMYEPERGAWLSARFVLTRGGAPEVTFNYSEDPGWAGELHPMMFVYELETYPRAEEHIPKWLRDLVEEGLELQRQHEAGQGDH